MSVQFETLDHTADTGFRAWAETEPRLFQTAAHALVEIAFDLPDVRPVKEVSFRTTGEDYEALLVDWLNEVLFLFDTGELAPASFEIDELTNERLRARIKGEPRNPSRHSWKVIVKAVTFYNIEVRRHDGRWEARVFLDI